MKNQILKALLFHWKKESWNSQIFGVQVLLKSKVTASLKSLQ